MSPGTREAEPFGAYIEIKTKAGKQKKKKKTINYDDHIANKQRWQQRKQQLQPSERPINTPKHSVVSSKLLQSERRGRGRGRHEATLA